MYVSKTKYHIISSLLIQLNPPINSKSVSCESLVGHVERKKRKDALLV
jgi:hypothetical protein